MAANTNGRDENTTLADSAVTFFATLGNGQDGAVPPPPPNGYGIQGNVAWSKAQHEADLTTAALAARQKKAMMNSMASVMTPPPQISTAEQFLAANKPPPLPPGEMRAPSPVRRDTYVPQFEAAPARSGRGEPAPASAPAPSVPAATPEKKGGLFGLFKSRDKDEDSSGPDFNPGSMPASSYPETSMISEPDPASATPPPVAPAVAPPVPGSSIALATEGAVPEEKPSFFGKLFGREKATQPSSVPDPTLSPPVPAMPASPLPAPAEAVGIPTPPAYSAPAAAPAAPSVPAPVIAPNTMNESPTESSGSIFVKRQTAESVEPAATVLTTTQATVDGVLVRLYEGTHVAVLERSGSMVRVRLPDQREGTVAASALGR